MSDRGTLHETAVSLVRTLYPLRAGIRLIGVTLSTFDAVEDEGQLDLLASGGGA